MLQNARDSAGDEDRTGDFDASDGSSVLNGRGDARYFTPLVSIPELHLEGVEIGGPVQAGRRRVTLSLMVSLVAFGVGLILYFENERFGLGLVPAAWIGLSVAVVSLIFPIVTLYRASAGGGQVKSVPAVSAEEYEDLSRYEGIVSSNQRLILQYHAMTTRQATSAYRNTQIAMAACLAVLLFGGVTVIQLQDGITRAIVGALAALGTGVASYLGATFIATYNRTLGQLNFFFGQPLVNSYLLAAERLSDKLSAEAHDRAVSKIVDQLLKNAATNSDILLGIKARSANSGKQRQSAVAVDRTGAA
ncbi:hypothetical protein SAMN04488564_104894 [Lentzea waywayandensis]|uniref:Cyanobacterial TRADD-N associated 2 transmembrane domain-containing protein n=1 Tax=Lentzea waywayandensis TaxID=84724 RepID=A0A1I6ELP4_9PSEU|nr:hypothetical protein [Lentzea waywayandensis]SFR18694.1 hypothetical protein SAMN04488564_104894 [Lentzea waywayandensis]